MFLEEREGLKGEQSWREEGRRVQREEGGKGCLEERERGGRRRELREQRSTHVHVSYRKMRETMQSDNATLYSC